MVLFCYEVIGRTNSFIVIDYKFNFYSIMFKINSNNVKFNLAKLSHSTKITLAVEYNNDFMSIFHY